MKSNMIIKHYRNGELIENSPLVAYLEHPNVLQSRNEFFQQRDIQKSLYGNAFTYVLKGSSLQTNPSAMWNLPPSLLKVVRTGKIFKETDVNEIVSKVILDNQTANGEVYEFSDLWHSNTPNPEDPLLGISPLVALKMPLSNIAESYKHRNVIMVKKGALGILSTDFKGDGGVPLTQAERERIEKEYNRAYGVNNDQSSVIMSQSNLRWQPISYPTKDLMLFEEVDADFKTIIDMYGLNDNLFSFGKASTFSNLYEGIKLAYQDTIIPDAKDEVESLSNYLKLPDNEYLEADFSHLAILSEDGSKKAERLNKLADACKKLTDTGIYTPAQLNEMFPVEMLKEFL
jgi:phage portal protein BeeE